MKNKSRREILQILAASTAGLALSSCANSTKTTAKTGTSKSVMGLAVPAMDVVRVGLIGVGNRGYGHTIHMCNIAGVSIKAICDIDETSLQKSVQAVVDKGFEKPAAYGSDEFAYRKLLARDDIDMVIISTPWRYHASMSIETMESGKHALVEVPAAVTVEECWALVETAERTAKNCMMMENVCYGREELMVLNMVRQGIFGELLHGEAAYIHELRRQMKEVDTGGTGFWRTGWHTKRDANLYPTHGLGPVAQYMNINRGDRFDYLSSYSSPALGRQLYAKEHFPAEHQLNQQTYISGDMNTTMIKTVKGRSIMVQHDTTTPRPYSRHNLIQGTKGVFAGFPNRIALESHKSYHDWDYDMKPFFERYDHPLWTRMGQEAVQNGGHGGMDFLMFWRTIYCLRNGVALDQDVYDAAAWSVLVPLTDESVANRSRSVDVPDFTRGKWQTATPLGIVS